MTKDDVRENDRTEARISAVMSILGVLITALLLFGAVREYRADGAGVWVGAGVALFPLSTCTLVRNLRRGRQRVRQETGIG
ncbi:hypothetical protein FNQ90_17885 [Streptomyces alkaliphilus]|uniref:Uncharacterized protein n=1 Tax=Streptomyces alkaliphilus TaxID=1472722 RepID=A0A7W3TG52_9ACTN|nr:hypothetical protein [Streptomyces alkaliphilus]